MERDPLSVSVNLNGKRLHFGGAKQPLQMPDLSGAHVNLSQPLSLPPLSVTFVQLEGVGTQCG